MVRAAVTLLLIMMVFPLFVLVTDSFMGSREILERFGPVLAGTEGRAEFVLFPQYPTLRAYVQLLLDSPEFFTAFWNSVFQTGMILAGQLVVAVPGAWAFARYRFPERRALWFLYMLLMILPFQVTMVSGYLVLSAVHLMDTHWGGHTSGSLFYPSCLYTEKDIFRDPAGDPGGGGGGRRRGTEDLSSYRYPSRKIRDFFHSDPGISGILERH